MLQFIGINASAEKLLRWLENNDLVFSFYEFYWKRTSLCYILNIKVLSVDQFLNLGTTDIFHQIILCFEGLWI